MLVIVRFTTTNVPTASSLFPNFDHTSSLPGRSTPVTMSLQFSVSRIPPILAVAGRAAPELAADAGAPAALELRLVAVGLADTANKTNSTATTTKKPHPIRPIHLNI